MTESDIVTGTPMPRTRETLGRDLRRLGLGAGDTALVHCSLSALGWVSGGATAVIQALRDVLTDRGTLVMPAQSADLTDPAGWEAPPVPVEWHEPIRASMPAFDPRTTPTRMMGAVAEQFRTWPSVLRSTHPTASFAAQGPEAGRITRHQSLNDPLGENSPLSALYQVGAQILLLGVGFDRCTALHLAERRAWPHRPAVEEGSPMLVAGERTWVRYRAFPLDAEPFPDAGQYLSGAGLVTTRMVGSAECHLLPVRAAVDAVIERWKTEAPER